MNVSGQIIEVLNDLCKKFGMAIDWSSENVLPYLNELCGRFINFEIYTSIFWMILILVICMICWIVFIATFKGAKAVEWDDCYFITIINVVALIAGIALFIISMIVIGAQAFDIIEAKYLPEKTIYDFITYQINSHN